MHAFCYYNGKIVRTKNAGLPLNDVGILRGYGVFDFLRTYGRTPFLYREHYRRFVHSARILDLTVPLGEKKVFAVIQTLLRKNKTTNCAVRMVLTGGVSPNGIDFKGANLFILTEDLKTMPTELFERGGKLILTEHSRQFREAKTTNYLTHVRLQRTLKKEKAIEILYHFGGEVLECATSNVFLFKGDTLVTPKKGILIGMTRNYVLKLARGRFKVVERAILLSELFRAQEAFITATNKEIIPIVSIGGKRIGNGKVGARTRILMELFRRETLKVAH
ncbi:MAG TPA: aminotransferase class IV [Candidatus Paceibacterota bacterium]